jgi:hypothetical protein
MANDMRTTTMSTSKEVIWKVIFCSNLVDVQQKDAPNDFAGDISTKCPCPFVTCAITEIQLKET